MRLLFSASDFGATRLLPLPAPLLELKFAARALRRGIATPWGERWRRRALSAFPITTPPGRAVVSHFSWALSPTVLGDDFAAGMDTMEHLTARQARAELSVFDRGPTEGAGAPPYLRHAISGDREATKRLGRATSRAYSAVLEPFWPDVQAAYRLESTRCAQLLAQHGVRAALRMIIPGSRWADDCLEVDGPQQRTVALRGRGLILAPVLFWAGAPLVGDVGDHPVVLAYPAATELRIAGGSESDSLAAILGATRAAVLRGLVDEQTTSEIALHLGISLASTSEHATALRNAHLISSRRNGKSVLHCATVLGRNLLAINGIDVG